MRKKQHDDTMQHAQENVLSEKEITQMCKVFQLLADPVRLKIVLALMTGDMCVGSLTKVSGVTQSAVSHQLRILRDNNIVVGKRLGQKIEYSIADGHVYEIIETSRAHLACENA